MPPAAGNAGRPGGVYDQTIANYNKMIELDPNDAEAYSGRALAYLKAGYPKQGLLDIQRALVLNPNRPSALDLRGNILEALGRKDDAITDYRLALTIQPNLKTSQDALKRLRASP